MKIKRQEAPQGDVPITYADISKAQDVLGYQPKTSLTEGIASFYKWMIKTEREKTESSTTSMFTH